MKKLIAVFALLCSMQSFANVINIDLNGGEDVSVGDNITVTLKLDNFDPFDTFSFDFIFDDSLLDFVAGSESSDLPDDGIDTFLTIADDMGFVGIGFLDFVGTQDGNFFVEFDFVATAVGAAVFSLENVFFEDFFGAGVLVVDDTASVDATISQVSAPASIALLSIGVALIAGFRRKG
ncbi:cohesin domain-containing protein [Glaciecola petra]|uniref:Cohesin domain-containing protein n=1 Tax=Glaciecola petra TaxID=3075602 RepID=A0ABU2ZVW6_9ALTE|nr:cohesin domain-containing protein [Aestuariibacter sp. P117]MDT0595567.1 cohesin domain-containing protein [Aestuariibacter sp. P117]